MADILQVHCSTGPFIYIPAAHLYDKPFVTPYHFKESDLTTAEIDARVKALAEVHEAEKAKQREWQAAERERIAAYKKAFSEPEAKPPCSCGRSCDCAPVAEPCAECKRSCSCYDNDDDWGDDYED